DAALSRKVGPAPAQATTTPPIAGPMARAALKLMPLSEIAAVKSLRDASSGTIACHAGAFSADPTPSAKLNTRRVHGVARCAIVSQPSAPAARSIHACDRISSRRLSTMSASAPAGSARISIGRLEAVWINATINGDGDSEVISHAAPTFCIQVPMFE